MEHALDSAIDDLLSSSFIGPGPQWELVGVRIRPCSVQGNRSPTKLWLSTVQLEPGVVLTKLTSFAQPTSRRGGVVRPPMLQRESK